ncbi:Mannose-1-phosphate guanylyltransferase [Thermoanaerobacterium thermosaccharolyticum DSM 571]|uniref:mannose-1-phosphate guanylyltransferase n=1 Tax=Thermoanaerobacterium thermosaccharolyticum (strain ATCC 7956 / DSM 571 / NCIMB 9385 / NCA 3814 / NCTC 13789 / WDCM 00135 / 2032) TaxID=580327 RepID=D9TMH3_THETC|nr:mannose-1-phosphate guanylyltransferase [Thermoanaerobacterium thermosaccharolyticum]ADL68461.1 Mannose-1-phosphate guanylyltransferase [Thermoanaerobacterium thermosaccharolyticum DSM 571]
MITGVIMAGGKGERFWPKSRIKMPKQFLKLYGDRTMIQQTVDRLKRLMPIKNIFVVTNIDYAGLISDQIPELPTENILIEPMGKNTAACIGLAALHTERLDKDSIMVVVPSDHVIKDEETYLGVLKTAIEKAKSGNNLVTIGIKPLHPETGYGYINFRKITHEILNNNPVHKVERFVEKPDYDTAVKYVESGNYLWNSGMFIWKTSTILNAIKEYMPQLYSALNVIREHFDSDEIEKVLYEEYSKLESISIDYGIMEKAKNVYVVPGDFGWDDVGSWTSIERLYEKDENGNVIKGNVVSVDTKKCIITGSDKLIATLGIEDVIVVDTEDALLICSKDKAQNVKEILKELKEKNSEYL